MDNQHIYDWLMYLEKLSLMGKSRVTSKKYVTIPCLELVAAVLSVEIAAQIKRELDTEFKNETFWKDSKVVLGYINNAKMFKIFVANQIQKIHEGSHVSHNETSGPVERTEAITDEDPEVKHLLTVNRIAENYGMLSYLTQRISSWKKLKKSSHNDPVPAKAAKDYQAKEVIL